MESKRRKPKERQAERPKRARRAVDGVLLSGREESTLDCAGHARGRRCAQRSCRCCHVGDQIQSVGRSAARPRCRRCYHPSKRNHLLWVVGTVFVLVSRCPSPAPLGQRRCRWISRIGMGGRRRRGKGGEVENEGDGEKCEMRAEEAIEAKGGRSE